MTQTTADSTPADDSNGLDNGAPIPGASGDVLKNVLESLIFVSDKPVTPKKLARAARSTIAEVQPLLDELVADYAQRGVHLYFVGGGYQFRSAWESSDFVRTFVAPKPIRLTRAQLETLAICAYRQPITRPEIDDVRGVDSGSALRMLAERRLIKILGRKDEPGRPLLYGTTAHFLEFFGLKALTELPTLQEFSDLMDEHKALFEVKTGQPIDMATAELEAKEAEELAAEELLAEELAAQQAAEAAARAEEEAHTEAFDDDDEDDDDEEDEQDA